MPRTHTHTRTRVWRSHRTRAALRTTTQTMAFVRRVLARPKRPEEAGLQNGGKPRRVVVCTIYFLDQQPNGSWADRVLGLLGYDSNPEKLKEAWHGQSGRLSWWRRGWLHAIGSPGCI